MTPATLDQPRAALAKANAVRSERAAMHRRVAAGELDVRDLLLDPPEILRPGESAKAPVTVARLLSWQHRWGMRRAAIFLRPFEVGPYTTPFDLSTARREQIVEALG